MKIQWHPLINPDSSHYEDEEGKVAIEEMEKETSICKMIGFCDCSIFKYEWRKDKKGQMRSDIMKIKTYEAYRESLFDLLAAGVENTISVHRAWEIVGKKWRYK